MAGTPAPAIWCGAQNLPPGAKEAPEGVRSLWTRFSGRWSLGQVPGVPCWQGLELSLRQCPQASWCYQARGGALSFQICSPEAHSGPGSQSLLPQPPWRASVGGALGG